MLIVILIALLLWTQSPGSLDCLICPKCPWGQGPASTLHNCVPFDVMNVKLCMSKVGVHSDPHKNSWFSGWGIYPSKSGKKKCWCPWGKMAPIGSPMGPHGGPHGGPNISTMGDFSPMGAPISNDGGINMPMGEINGHQDVLCTVLPYKASIPMDYPHGGQRITHIR